MCRGRCRSMLQQSIHSLVYEVIPPLCYGLSVGVARVEMGPLHRPCES